MRTTVFITIALAFICRHTDYCSSFFAVLPRVCLLSLQSVLNSAARLIACLHCFSDESIFLTSKLRWLSIEVHTQFHMLLMISKADHGQPSKSFAIPHKPLFALSLSQLSFSLNIDLPSSSKGQDSHCSMPHLCKCCFFLME